MNVPSTVVVAKSPIATGMASPPGLARSLATIASERSIPCTGCRAAERQRDAAGADAELERRAVAGQIGEEVDGRVDDRRVEHVGGRLVVALCNSLAEVILGHGRTLSEGRIAAASGSVRLVIAREPEAAASSTASWRAALRESEGQAGGERVAGAVGVGERPREGAGAQRPSFPSATYRPPSEPSVETTSSAPSSWPARTARPDHALWTSASS